MKSQVKSQMADEQFSNFPAELLRQIYNVSDTKTAARLSRVCRRLNKVGREVTLQPWRDVDVILANPDVKLPPFISFLNRYRYRIDSLTLRIPDAAVKLESFHGLLQLPRLKSLDLSKNLWLEKKHLAIFPPKFPALESLNLDHCTGLGKSIWVCESVYRWARQLKTLNFNYVRFEKPAAVDRLNRLMARCQIVENFEMQQSGPEYFDTNTVMHMLETNRDTLKTLRVNTIEWNTQFLNALSSCRNISFLSIGFSDRVADADPKSIISCLRGLTVLQHLHLAVSSRTNGNGMFFTEWTKLWKDPPFSLKQLSLALPDITDFAIDEMLRGVLSTIKVLSIWLPKDTQQQSARFPLNTIDTKKSPLKMLLMCNWHGNHDDLRDTVKQFPRLKFLKVWPYESTVDYEIQGVGLEFPAVKFRISETELNFREGETSKGFAESGGWFCCNSFME